MCADMNSQLIGAFEGPVAVFAGERLLPSMATFMAQQVFGIGGAVGAVVEVAQVGLLLTALWGC